ncbi:related to O-methyltransferase [Rhynchosporium agropyri]|uniref:Related to O-methyltransferase n=1 Tax=Rhynchosporium agropyri TaxID=914238 RepID=A0A1E1K5X8_9HELO|nr:related to O-methyltransferase [Rhynchosporium agropyri]
MASLLELVQDVQVAAEAVASGDGGSDNLLLLRALRRLNRVAEPPAERMRRVVYQPVQNATIRLAVEMGLPHALVEAKEMSADELAAKSGADKTMIVRVIRVLAAMDLVDQIGDEQYQANPSTEALASTTWTSGVRFIHDTLAPTYAKVVDYYRDTGFRSSDKTAMSYAVGTDFWKFLNERPSLHQDFHNYMRGRKEHSPRWLDYFPVSTQVGDLSTATDAATLVDIGGNLGHDLKLFREKCPEIPGRAVLMDLPEVVRGNKDPLVGAKFYLFRAICHDWPDKECLKFLGNTVKAMKPGYSRLLINDQVLPDVGAELHPVTLDMTMLTYFNAMERTERQWRTLLGSLGVEIVKIWRFEAGGSEAVIETMLKE